MLFKWENVVYKNQLAMCHNDSGNAEFKFISAK